jgi:zinc protease
MVASTFGALPAREAVSPAFADARVAQFPAPAAHPVVLRHTGAANRALALIYWPTVDDQDTKKVRTLELLRSVLQLKLIDRVREQESATYSPSAQATFSRVSPGYGYIGVSLDLVPGDVDRFFGIVDQIVAQMGSGGISDDELNRARLPILDEYPHRLEDNRYWMGLVSTAQSDPALLARHRTTVADYQAVTVADLRAAAALYLRANRAYRVAILPPEGAAAPAAPAATPAAPPAPH